MASDTWQRLRDDVPKTDKSDRRIPSETASRATERNGVDRAWPKVEEVGTERASERRSVMYVVVMLVMSILALGLIYVVVPVALTTYRRFRSPKTVICPETGRGATIRLNAEQAAISATVGTPDLQVRDCANWPERRPCAQDCLAQLDPESGRVNPP
jgi:hypothetical protein